MRHERVNIIGAGLAGSEAAWQLAERGHRVRLHEMRPKKMTPAHQTGQFAELVCSNSFGSEVEGGASQILKSELDTLGAFVLNVARTHRVPAGGSLAVDREKFAAAISTRLQNHPQIEVHANEVTEIPSGELTIVATGPLTSESLAQSLCEFIGSRSLYFYDSISPIVSAESLNFDKMFFASRYEKGDPDFLNIPITESQYFDFIEDLLEGEVLLPHNFEEAKYFEGCLPIETIAARGKMSLAFGPMKPVGLVDPKSGKRPFAVVQLRAENRYRSSFNLVGFQTKLKYPEQLRVFRKLPGMEEAEFLRLGSMHRNTYINSPQLLKPTLQLREHENIFVAGQLTGTEGYLESTATGLVAGINAAQFLKGQPSLSLPEESLLGGLLMAITDPTKTNFQPMNVNMGLVPPLGKKLKKRERNIQLGQRSHRALQISLQNQFL